MPKPSLTLEPYDEPEALVGNYFTSDSKKSLEFIPTGCHLLDLSIGGGWPLGKVSNTCGDYSSGKSLLSIEAMTNFHLKWPNGHIFYLEAEAGFDIEYAEAMGLPAHAVTFVGVDVLEDFTIESWYEHISSILDDKSLQNEPMLYILDSLDAMSDRAEIGRDITDGSYNMTKQKKLGELFRRLTKQVEKSRLHLQIVSQLRENIGSSFGKKFRRSGGKALDFYASQVLWLTRKKQIKKTKNKVERVVGVEIATNCEKNKVSMPFRKSDFKILFGYGIDDEQSMLEWLKEIDALKEYRDPISGDEIKSIEAYLRKYKNLDKSDRTKVHFALAKVVTKKWFEIEKSFLPTFSKY